MRDRFPIPIHLRNLRLFEFDDDEEECKDEPLFTTGSIPDA